MADTEWDKDPDIADQTVNYFVRGAKTLWKLSVSEHPRLVSAGIALVVAEILGLGVPLIFKEIVDRLTQQGMAMSTLLIILMSLMLVLRLASVAIRRFVQEPLFLKAVIRLENEWPVMAHKKLLELSTGYHDRENTGRKIAKVNKGVERLVAMVADTFWMLLPALAYIGINLIVLFCIDWRFALMLVLPIGVYVWLNLKCYSRFYSVWERFEERKEHSVGLFCQSIVNVRTVQAYVREVSEGSTHQAVRAEMHDIDIEASIRLQRYFFAMEAVIAIGFTATIAAGFYFVTLGWTTVGTVAYVFATGSVMLQSLWGVVQVYTRMLRYLVAAERMHKLLLEEPDVCSPDDASVPRQVHGTIAFKKVTHHYPGRNAPVLKALDFTIEPGEMVAFVGKSGAGKSTIVNLLARVSDPAEGAVCLDDTDIRNFNRNWYRARCACVPQDVEVFEGTIRHNVVYGCPDVSERLVTQAIQASCLEETLADTKRFPLGIDTQVGERGVRLSGGERQRVGIARAYVALLSGARVLILDEATASLDSASERVVQTFIDKLREERDITIIAIAHRLSTIKRADRIIVLDEGHISEIGDHRKLIADNGIYAQLVALQQLEA
ncbi:MAG: ABC transporter ATP-binding protein [Patescibacteria group bacterium]